MASAGSLRPSGGLAGWSHPISSQNPAAQRYFDQRLTLAYGFNHAAAEASFREAARLDPSCAICYWGAALVAGPNINAPMAAEAAAPAWTDLAKALELAPSASPAERDYIAALARRYAEHPPADRGLLDAAYADAMRELAARHPDDADAAVLLAEALMDLHPWDFWQASGAEQPWTGEILATLEKALTRWPQHPGANHLYIHTVEASKNPGRAMAAADRLRELAPAAGHLVHMPAHIYQRVGRYRDSAEANRQAIEADRDSGSPGCHGGAIYELAYVPHNFHFLWAALIQEGAGAEAVQVAEADRSRSTPRRCASQARRAPALLHHSLLHRGALRPLARNPGLSGAGARPAFPRAIRHFARGLALLRGGELDSGRKRIRPAGGAGRRPGARRRDHLGDQPRRPAGRKSRSKCWPAKSRSPAATASGRSASSSGRSRSKTSCATTSRRPGRSQPATTSAPPGSRCAGRRAPSWSTSPTSSASRKRLVAQAGLALEPPRARPAPRRPHEAEARPGEGLHPRRRRACRLALLGRRRRPETRSAAPQGGDRVELHRPSGRQDSEEKADQQRGGEGADHRPPGRAGAERREDHADDPGDAEADHQAEQAAQAREQGGLGQEDAEDLAVPRPLGP